MPIGAGWWLNPEDGRALEIFEHLDAVLSEPRTFGLRPTPALHRGESADDFRTRVLTEVMQNGWIRVRSYQGSTVFEFWHLDEDVADAVWQFIGDVLGATMGELRLSEVESGIIVSSRIESFFQDVKRFRRRRNPSAGNRLYLFARALGQGR